uniref:EGF-like-domain, multiple 11 n=1 Tax=Pan troglodytes TaxID=9598 RepID=G2HGR2_PANTR|nr:EGF-like-domain, multiple 11 [Pan troglodytes]
MSVSMETAAILLQIVSFVNVMSNFQVHSVRCQQNLVFLCFFGKEEFAQIAVLLILMNAQKDLPAKMVKLMSVSFH